ncbi:MAG: hypothetical protein H8E85_05035 [Candidatus Marinimicrobia bacterium]|nr:hypothetical protein [Candidatus Neomarinimicrobiota bacterium]
MIEIEILLLAIIIICISIYIRNWTPTYPSFYSSNKLIKIGHRGVPSLAHENTLDSFQKAIDTGMAGVELDVQYSADKKLVVYHNWDIECDSGEIELIENLSYSHIQKISLNGDEKDKIPLFTDVLKILNKNCIINIEIKSAKILNTGIEKKVLKTVKEFNFENNCIISSFNPFILKRVKKINPNILTAFLWSNQDPQLIFNTPLWVWLCRPDAFHVDINHLDENLMNWIQRKKMSVLAFTVITQMQLKKAQKLGVNGIIMDDPNLI